MRTTIKTINALAVVLALRAEAVELSHFGSLEMLAEPQTCSTEIMAGAEVHRLTKRLRLKLQYALEILDEIHRRRHNG